MDLFYRDGYAGDSLEHDVTVRSYVHRFVCRKPRAAGTLPGDVHNAHITPAYQPLQPAECAVASPTQLWSWDFPSNFQAPCSLHCTTAHKPPPLVPTCTRELQAFSKEKGRP